MNVKKISFLALLVCLGLIMFLVEGLFPPLFFFAPGAKLGLSNIFVLIALIIYGAKEGLIVLVVKCVISIMFTGNVFSLIYSLSGGILSLVIMSVFLLFVPKIGLVTVSIMGGIFHNIGQILIASLILETTSLFYYLPLLLGAGVAAGIVVGFSTYFVIKYVPLKRLV